MTPHPDQDQEQAARSLIRDWRAQSCPESREAVPQPRCTCGASEAWEADHAVFCNAWGSL